ncbi:GTPase activating protein (GAP) for Rho1p, partial [Coemansia sp. RSA 2611]
PGADAQLFGMPLACAVKVAGVRVGRVAGSSEACVVPTVVAACGRHLWDHGQHTQGIFRVNGSMKRVQRLQEEFNAAPAYGRHTDWSGYTLHDAATILRRYLAALPQLVIPSEHYDAFMGKLSETAPDADKARDYGAMIARLLQPEARHTLLYMLELLAGFAQPANSGQTLMNASNLAAVLQPCLMVHPGHVANPQEYSRAKDVVEFLIVHAAAMCPADEPVAATGAGLIVFDGDESQSADGERGRFVASDDGTTVDTSANELRGTPQQQQQQQQNRWSAAFTRESAVTAVQSGDSAPAHPAVSTADSMPSASAVPPRGDSLVTGNMARSTPVISSNSTQVRSLGSVTARLYDPESPDNTQPPYGSHSNLALSSIQYQYTVPARTREARAESNVEPATAPRSPPGARPRRSISFVAAPAVPGKDSELNAQGASDQSRMDAFTQDIISRSSNAVHARRGVGERRPGQVHVSATGLGLEQRRHKQLPPIPQRVVSATASLSVDAIAQARAGPESASGSEGGPRRAPASTFDASTGYQLYPRVQAPRTASVVSGSKATSHSSSSHAGGAPGHPAWPGTPEMSAGGRATWLSEDVPEDEYEFVGGRRTRTQPDGEQLRRGAEMAAAAAALTEAQQQKLHPIGRLGPMTVQPPIQQQQQQQQRVVVSADGSRDKTSMTRLKNIFRMGHGARSRVAGSEHGEGPARFTKPISSPRLTPGTFQHQPNSVAAFGGPVFNGAVAAAAAAPLEPQAMHRDLPPPPPPLRPAESGVGRLQVVVPAGHLSIVYPDSPMSKADTLRRTSADSAKRHSAGVAAGRTSGHAYLVNPDEDPDEESDEDDTYQGADLHQAPSNTTTLRPASQIHQPNKQAPYGRQPNAHPAASATFAQRDSTVLGTSSASPRRVYAMQRMADSDTQINRRMHPGGFVLPTIGNGSPLLSSLEFDSPTAPSHPQTPRRRSRVNASHYHARESAVSKPGEPEEDVGTNSPRRSRSLRNTITSLRRKLSKSSRNGAVGGSPDTSMEESAPTASVH